MQEASFFSIFFLKDVYQFIGRAVLDVNAIDANRTVAGLSSKQFIAVQEGAARYVRIHLHSFCKLMFYQLSFCNGRLDQQNNQRQARNEEAGMDCQSVSAD